MYVPLDNVDSFSIVNVLLILFSLEPTHSTTYLWDGTYMSPYLCKEVCVSKFEFWFFPFMDFRFFSLEF